jgi:hypothetical protein
MPHGNKGRSLLGGQRSRQETAILRGSSRELSMRKPWGGNVALEAKPLGGAGVEVTAALMVMTAALQKLVKHSKVFMTAIEHSIRHLKRSTERLPEVLAVHDSAVSTLTAYI